MARPREVPHSMYVWLAALWHHQATLHSGFALGLRDVVALALAHHVEPVWWAIAQHAAVVQELV